MTVKPLQRLALAALAPIALAACAQTPQSTESMALACQTTECICVEETQSIFESGGKAPVQWKQNGDAFCQDGYVLQRVTEEKQGGY